MTVASVNTPLRCAYADPPYPGQSKRHYGDHPDYAGEVDHAELIERLERDFPDGWALSTSVAALPNVLALCPRPEPSKKRAWGGSMKLGTGVRICVWKRTPTKAHEYLFLLTRSPRYFYDAAAISEPAAWARWGAQTVKKKMPGAGSWLRDKTKAELDATVWPRHRKQDDHESRRYAGFNDRWDASEDDGTAPKERNKRSVWEIATESYPDAHFATFPQALVEPCIKAGCPLDGTVLDPFLGSGTTALVARRLGRKSVGIELSPEYARLAAKRLGQLSLLAEPAA